MVLFTDYSNGHLHSQFYDNSLCTEPFCILLTKFLKNMYLFSERNTWRRKKGHPKSRCFEWVQKPDRNLKTPSLCLPHSHLQLASSVSCPHGDAKAAKSFRHGKDTVLRKKLHGSLSLNLSTKVLGNELWLAKSKSVHCCQNTRPLQVMGVTQVTTWVCKRVSSQQEDWSREVANNPAVDHSNYDGKQQ